MAHHKANTEPACSRACFCLGFVSTLGNIVETTSQNHLHNLVVNDSDCLVVLLVPDVNVDASITHVAGTAYCVVDLHDGANILYRLGFVHEIN